MTDNSTPEKEDFRLLFASNRPLEIEAASAALQDEDIHSFQINKRDTSYIFGEIELYVLQSDLDKAKSILQAHDLL
jgi:hypothetical protein